MRMLLILAALATLPVAAFAQPDPRQFTFDSIVVGSPNGTAIGGAPPGFDVTVRDPSLNPVPNAHVTLKFSGSGIALYLAQAPATTVNCATGSITRLTDPQGHVNFVPRMGGWANANAVGVEVEGVVVGMVPGRSPDYDADGHAALSDLAVFTFDLLHDPAAQRSDFDLDGSTGLGDLALMTGQLLGAPPVQARCP
jgi:hypothetical protein